MGKKNVVGYVGRLNYTNYTESLICIPWFLTEGEWGSCDVRGVGLGDSAPAIWLIVLQWIKIKITYIINIEQIIRR